MASLGTFRVSSAVPVAGGYRTTLVLEAPPPHAAADPITVTIESPYEGSPVGRLVELSLRELD